MIDIKVMAVESRKEHAESVLEKVRDNPTAKIIYDDRGINGGGGAWYNARRCWLTNTNAEYQMVIQDDVVLCDDFLKYVDKCINFQQEAVWSFYCGRKVDVLLQGKYESPYVHVRGCKTSGQAILIPKKYVKRMIEETDIIFGENYKHDDSRIGWWCCFNKIPLFTTVPSLCNHKQIQSVIPHHNSKRYSRIWIGRDVSKTNWESKKINETPFVFPYLWMNEENENYRRAYEYCQTAKRRAKEEWK